MSQRARSWILFSLRWAIALGGIGWVLANLSLRDHVTILDENGLPVVATVVQRATEDSSSFVILDPMTGQQRIVSRQQTVNQPDRKGIYVQTIIRGASQRAELLALDLTDNLRQVRRLLVRDPESGRGLWVGPAGYQLHMPRPRLNVGLISMLALARPALLWAALLVFPIAFLVTSIRWHALLKAVDIRLTHTRTFILTMVGAFYSTFMPGLTGGDLLKAYYAALQTPHRAAAVVSVLVDRLIGLLALVVLGGAAAAYNYARLPDGTDPAARACLHVALGSVAILLGTMAMLAIFRRPVRQATGIDLLLRRLPFQRQLQHAMAAMRMYRTRPALMFGCLVGSIPVHVATVCSGLFAGQALGLPLPPSHYFVAVPVIVLGGALPITPQGAGVMEFFAVQLTGQYGATVSQAFALTLSLRVVQMFWNLTGGIIVLRGGYHAPTHTQREQLQAEADRESVARAEGSADGT